jgi:hypothetical protein
VSARQLAKCGNALALRIKGRGDGAIALLSGESLIGHNCPCSRGSKSGAAFCGEFREDRLKSSDGVRQTGLHRLLPNESAPGAEVCKDGFSSHAAIAGHGFHEHLRHGVNRLLNLSRGVFRADVRVFVRGLRGHEPIGLFTGLRPRAPLMAT